MQASMEPTGEEGKGRNCLNVDRARCQRRGPAVEGSSERGRESEPGRKRESGSPGGRAASGIFPSSSYRFSSYFLSCYLISEAPLGMSSIPDAPGFFSIWLCYAE